MEWASTADLGRSKVFAAMARKPPVTVWHVLHEEVADRFADPHAVAVSFPDYAIGWV